MSKRRSVFLDFSGLFALFSWFGFCGCSAKMSCPKWLPKDLQNSYHLFSDLSRATVTFKWLSNRYLSEISIDVPDTHVRYFQIPVIQLQSAIDWKWHLIIGMSVSISIDV